MPEFEFMRSFLIDNGELDGLRLQNAFVLGYELAMVDFLLEQGLPFERPVHADNQQRIELSCRAAARDFTIKWLPDGAEQWMWLAVNG